MVCLLFLSSCTQSGAPTESTEAPPQTETAAETAASSEAPETEPEKEEEKEKGPEPQRRVTAYFANWYAYDGKGAGDGEVAGIPWDKVTAVNHSFWKVAPAAGEDVSSFERRASGKGPRSEFRLVPCDAHADLNNEEPSELLEGVSSLQIIVEMRAGEDTSLVEIAFAHTNIVRIEKNGETLFKKGLTARSATETDRSLLNLKDIYDFANTVEISEVRDLLERQVECNLKIAEEGFSNKYGANVGATILESFGNDVRNRARAYPAAGSDARMNGCVLPVMINSGSGNQGMTVSLPVEIYARELHVSEEKKIRALVLSNLIAIYQKNELGKLSAYCGVVSASVGAGAAIAYLHNADWEVIEETIVNTLGNISGIVCDGAKASCAAKIASSVDAAVMAYHMAAVNRGFRSGEGLVKQDAEHTLQSYGRMGREGMKATDIEILKIMLEE